MKKQSEQVSTPNPDQRRKRLRVLLMGGVPLLAIIVGLYFYMTGGRYVTSDDAYVKASNKVEIAAEVEGRVEDVAVKENQRVTTGQILFRVNDESYRIALAKVTANLATVHNELDALRATYQQKQAELAQVNEDIKYYQREFDRLRHLADRKTISENSLDEAEHRLKSAQLHSVSVQHELDKVKASLGTNPDLPTEQHPRYLQVKAQRDQADLDLRRTVIYAPSDGIVSNLNIDKGDYIKPGNPVFSLVGSEYYIVANLKETQLVHLQPGQPASVEVDAYPGLTLTATVASISPATGAEFSVLPAQNATGNWVKVVQRVPVRLTLADPAVAPDLRSGLSVTVDIDTGYTRNLFNMFGGARADTGKHP